MDDLSDRLERLVDDHAAGLKLYARSLGASADAAEDIVAEAFAGLWRQLADGRKIDVPPAYLARCVRHAAGRRLQRDARRRAVESQAPTQDWFDPDRGADLTAWAARAVASLPVKQREVVILKIWSGLTFEQIGRALDIPISTAGHRYRTALETLSREEKPHEH
ncbi:MAG: RNA polymerase sigma factor [Phycisphaerales bacterium]|nr:RNA polymerase sigma factor [Phycisphaerales bacterium]